jgi:hypothetical protein
MVLHFEILNLKVTKLKLIIIMPCHLWAIITHRMYGITFLHVLLLLFVVHYWKEFSNMCISRFEFGEEVEKMSKKKVERF